MQVLDLLHEIILGDHTDESTLILDNRHPVYLLFDETPGKFLDRKIFFNRNHFLSYNLLGGSHFRLLIAVILCGNG